MRTYNVQQNGYEIPIFWKDPNSVLDYTINWSSWLDGDTISTSTWVLPSGITNDSDSNTTTTASITLSSGSHNVDYKLVNRIVTAASLTHEQAIRIQARDSDASHASRSISATKDYE